MYEHDASRSKAKYEKKSNFWSCCRSGTTWWLCSRHADIPVKRVGKKSRRYLNVGICAVSQVVRAGQAPVDSSTSVTSSSIRNDGARRTKLRRTRDDGCGERSGCR